MPAIITSKFRYQNAKNLITDISDAANSYYLFAARSESWPVSDTTIPTPADRQLDEYNAWSSALALKKIVSSQVSNASPRYNWISGTTYSEYDDQDLALSTKQYYVITDELNVYKCIQAGAGASVTKPTGTSTAMGTVGADGYRWKYMFTVTGTDTNKFLTNSFIPVKKLASDDGSLQWGVQAAAVNGGLHRIRVLTGGTGYTSAPSVSIVGDGTGAVATATVAGGVVTGITVTNPGTGYSRAIITLSGGGASVQGTVRPVISPKGGHGSDPVSELGGFYVMIQVLLEGADGSGDFIVDNDYRQLCIVRNPQNFGTTTTSTATTLTALTTLNHGAVTGGSFAKDLEVTGQTSGAKGYIVSVGTGNIKIYQNDSTGYRAFNSTEIVTSGGASATLSSITNAEVKKYSGEVVYIENRTSVNRSSSQTEDVRLVVEM